MNKLKTGLIALFLISTTLQLRAKDPQFSQFYANPMYTNPAFAGSEYGRIALAYRIQYPELIPFGFNTFNASYDQRASKIRGGFGMMFTRDAIGKGLLSNTSFNASYAYELETKAGMNFRLGIQAGFYQKKLHGYVYSALPPFIEYKESTITKANIGAGLLMYSKKFYIGFACHNITEPNESFYYTSGPGSRLPRRYTIHAGLVMPMGNKVDSKGEPEITISPNILMMSQGKFSQFNVGFYANKGPIVLGFWFRRSMPQTDAIIGSLGLRLGRFKIGGTFDYTVTHDRGAGKTAYEVTVMYQFGTKKNPRTLICPTF